MRKDQTDDAELSELLDDEFRSSTLDMKYGHPRTYVVVELYDGDIYGQFDAVVGMSVTEIIEQSVKIIAHPEQIDAEIVQTLENGHFDVFRMPQDSWYSPGQAYFVFERGAKVALLPEDNDKLMSGG